MITPAVVATAAAAADNGRQGWFGGSANAEGGKGSFSLCQLFRFYDYIWIRYCEAAKGTERKGGLDEKQ